MWSVRGCTSEESTRTELFQAGGTGEPKRFDRTKRCCHSLDAAGKAVHFRVLIGTRPRDCVYRRQKRRPAIYRWRNQYVGRVSDCGYWFASGRDHGG